MQEAFDSLPIRTDIDRPYLIAKLREECEPRLNFTPHDWQLHVACDLIQGKSEIVLAKTGQGKSLPFVLPGLVTKKTALVLSPLNALEDDQALKFNSLGFRALSLNSTTCRKDILEAIKKGEYDIVFTSPELVLDSRKWRELIASPEFQELWGLIAVDEVHCILNWGIAREGKPAFRPAWGRISEIKALIPSKVPWLMVTATLTTYELPLIRSILLLPDNIKVTNLGNDRPEIWYECRRIEDKVSSFRDITNLVDPEAGNPLRSTMIFFGDRATPHIVEELLWRMLDPLLRDQIAVYHALRTEGSKASVMEKFRKGEIRVLLCTEAAGMVRAMAEAYFTNSLKQGCDIPHVEVVIQWRVPPSLGIWLQRGGRAGRGRNSNGTAIMLVPASWYRKAEQMGISGDFDPPAVGFSREMADSTVESMGCDLPMCSWILNQRCRRIVTDFFYDNPPRQILSSEHCCDNCNTSRRTVEPEVPVNQELGVSPEPQPTYNNPLRPESITSPLVKGKGERPTIPLRKKARKLQHQLELDMAVHAWRQSTWEHEFPAGRLPIEIIMPDAVINKVCKYPTFASLDALTEIWTGTARFGESLLGLVKQIDRKFALQYESISLRKLWGQVSETTARRAREIIKEKAKQAKEAREAEKRAARGKSRVRGRGGKPRRAPLSDLNSPAIQPGLGVFSLNQDLSPYTPFVPPTDLPTTPLHGVVLDLGRSCPAIISETGPDTEDFESPGPSHHLSQTDSNPFLTPFGSSASFVWPRE